MRVFWPKTGITREHGVAVGWRLGDSLCVVAVVPEWPLDVAVFDRLQTYNVDGPDSSDKFNADSSIRPLAHVRHIASPGQEPEHDLTIRTNDYLPVSYSSAVNTILYTPVTSRLAYLTLGDQPRHGCEALTRQEGYAPQPGADGRSSELVDFPSLLHILSNAGRVQLLIEGEPLPSDEPMPLGTAIRFSLLALAARLAALLLLGIDTFTPLRLVGDPISSSPRTSGADSVYRTAWETLDSQARYWGSTFTPSNTTLLPPESLAWQLWALVAWAISVSSIVVAGLNLLLMCLPTMTRALRDNDVHGQPQGLRTAFWRRSVILRQAVQRVEYLVSLSSALSRYNADPAAPRHTMAMLATDVCLGIAARHMLLSAGSGSFLSHFLSGWLDNPSVPSAAALADPIISALQWLNTWPVGLKLNTPLSEFMASTFTQILNTWRDVAVSVSTGAAGPATRIMSIAAYAGLSFPLAMIADFAQLATLHLRLCHFATATLSRWTLVALQRLWDLFRGKRWNVLRGRVDSHAYDVDTLFLGTLLFTVMAFLAPTVFAYAALFAVINLSIVSLQRVLTTSIRALNTAPVFELRERLLHPQSIPAGIVFDTIPQSLAVDRCVLELKSTPRSIGDIIGSWVGLMTQNKTTL